MKNLIIMKKSIFTVFVLALLLSANVSGQAVTVAPANGKGNSFENAITVPLETVINFNSNKLEKVYFTFDAPFNAKYHIQNAEEGGAHATFCLYSSNKKRIDKNTVIVEELNAGSYTIEVISRDARADVKMSVIVTLNTLNSFDTPQKIKERQAEIAKASVTPLTQNIGFDITENRDSKWYRFQVTDAARYQFSISCSQTDVKYPPNFNLYNDKYRSLMYSNKTEEMIALLPGTYYLKVILGSAKEGNNVSVVYTKEGEDGWDYKEKSWLAKFEKKYPIFYMAFMGLLGLIIPVILYSVAYRPYTGYLKEEYGIRFFGFPFFIMLAVLTGIIFLENYKNITPGVLQYTILIVTDILCTLWLCLNNFRKTKKPLLLVTDIILLHIAWVFAFVFLLATFVIAIVIIIAVCSFFMVKGATSMVESVGFGDDGVSGTEHEMCPSCGARKIAGKRSCSCGYM